MANAVTTQVLQDGSRNAVVKLTGVLDTANESYVVKINPANFAGIPIGFSIHHIDYSISDPLEIQLFWDATTPAIIQPLAGRGKLSFSSFGGLVSNAGAGGTPGAIGLLTTGYISGVTTYSLILELVKNGTQ
jgi:hypothetical protein